MALVMFSVATPLLAIYLLFLLFGRGESITCFCQGVCGNEVQCVGIVCFVRLNNQNKYEEDIDYGCFDDGIGGVTSNTSGVCHGGNHETTLFKCCDNAPFCNQNLTISWPPYNLTQTSVNLVPSSSLLLPGGSTDSFVSKPSFYVTLPIVSMLLIVISVIIAVIIVVAMYRKKRKLHSEDTNDSHKHFQRNDNVYQNGKDSCVPRSPSFTCITEIEPVPITVSDITITCTSGSGSGMPFLVKRTIARGFTLGEIIGGGRFGQVYLGFYQGEKYAVKKFFSRDEQSWFRESEIYNSVNLRHENILTCFATDILSNNGVTELWLITQFHPRGSLFDELHRDPFTVEKTKNLILSACRGISYLHMELSGTQGKPSIAHRDIKSKNMLVKNDDTVCIADFGLAVVANNSVTLNTPDSLRQGTKRYMAPEVLEEKINIKNFESFIRTDMYAFGLVLWEICRRCQHGGDAEEFQVPFQSYVPSDPTFEEMREIVVVKEITPEIPNRWTNNEFLRGISKLMIECWYRDPAARPTSFYIRKKLDRLVHNCDLKLPLD